MKRLTSRRGVILVAALLFGLVALSFLPSLQVRAAGESVSLWLTTADQANLLSQKSNLTFTTPIGSNSTTINVNEGTSYQQMVGFGASLTDSSAWLIYTKLSASQRSTLMNNLFSASSGAGLDFLRQPMGASDLTRPESGEYSYDDMPAGQTDTSLAHFSISHDSAYIIPVLQQAFQINSNIKIMATPWSPPGWMKSTGSMEGGTLNSSAYAAYANYFVKFIQAYQAQGLPIYAITIQNEPLYTPSGYPGMSMPATTQRDFIKNNLGPTFSSNGITTKILAYDHNWDQPSYPQTILSDATANSYTSGVAWHCYGGTADAQTSVHNSYPGKDVYETECSGGTWEGSNWPDGFRNTMELLINSTRNWGKTVVRWGMALDTNNGPNLGTGASCTTCRGIVTINQSTGAVTYNSDYYALGQASKFVVPGAVRIDSNSFGSGNIEDVAFKNPDGSKVLLVYNGSSASKTFQVAWNNAAFSYTLPAGAAATFKWSGTASGTTPTPTATSGSGVGTGYYYIKNNYSGKVLDDTGWSTSDGTKIEQWTQISGQTNQQWSFVSTGDGYYYIVNRYSGKALDDTDGSTADGAQVQQWTLSTGNFNQEWSLVSAGGGLYYIKNRHSGKVLDDTNWSTSDGTLIQQWTQINGQANQLWSLVAA